MKLKKICIATMAGALMVTGAPARENAPVAIATASYQKVPLKDKKGKIMRGKDGKPVTHWVRATKVVPGEVVRYVNTLSNRTNQEVEAVRVVNPIDPHLSYLKDSAACSVPCRIRYSVDGGKHFDVPTKLFVGQGPKRRLAKPGEYNAVEWVIDRLKAESNATVEFKARLK